jgi:periplasmic protein TonB
MDSLCALKQCLVDSDVEALRQDRKARQVGLAASFALETALVAILILLPLLAPAVAPRFASINAIPVWRPPVAVRVQPSQPARPLSAPQYIPNGTSRPNAPFHREAADTGRAGVGVDFGAPAAQGNPLDILGVSRPVISPQPAAQKPGASRPLPVGGGVMEAMLVKRVDPAYPTIARNTRTSGAVVLSAIIATDGTIQSLKVVSGNPLLIGAALAAVGQWRYKPTLLDGQPVEVETLITVNFVLQE